jgi:hypothetical protein
MNRQCSPGDCFKFLFTKKLGGIIWGHGIIEKLRENI